jgi:hypothetical protein
MKRALALATVVLFAACSRDFQITGSITVAAHVQSRVPKTNFVLFIVAKNSGGVPVAVKRIVNPQFPVDYKLGPEDLIVPGQIPKGPLSLSVEMNTHGNVGAPVKGDLRGECPDKVTAGERGVHVVIDKIVEPARR